MTAHLTVSRPNSFISAHVEPIATLWGGADDYIEREHT